jgi:NADPH:quinone reductase-like Zn-dependent oxidoreductase
MSKRGDKLMSNSTARIVRFHEIGGTLQLEEVLVPDPGENEVRIRVKAIGLNRVEALFWAGKYFVQPVLPSKIGVEASGIVEAVGPGVDPSWLGKAISTIPSIPIAANGVAGEVAILPISVLAEHPTNLSFEEAAAIWMPYLTSYGALVQDGKFGKGDFVLLTAASSSIGLAAIQTIRAQGGASIATTRASAKKADLLALGADHVIVTGEEDLVERVMEITGDGARLVMDSIAGEGLNALAQATATGGTIVVAGFLGTDMFGYADGMPTPFPFIDAVGRNLNIRGFNAQGLMSDQAAMKIAKSYIFDRLVAGDFKPKVDKIFTLEKIEEAYRYLDTNAQIGKIVVTV